MTDQLLQEEGALTRAAAAVEAAQSELQGHYAALSSEIAGLVGAWQGMGAQGYQVLMAQWGDRQQRITAALSGFHDALTGSEAVATAADDAARAASHQLAGRLGGA